MNISSWLKGTMLLMHYLKRPIREKQNKMRVYISLSIIPIWIVAVTAATVYLAPALWPIAIFVAVPAFKVGITRTNRLKQRNREISESKPGFVWTVLTLRHKKAYKVEQNIHRLLRFGNIPYFGNGKTEYFASPLLPIALLMLLWARYWFIILVTLVICSMWYILSN